MIGLFLVIFLAGFSNGGLLPWTDNGRNITEFTAQVQQGILWDGQCVADTRSRLLRVDLGKFDDNTVEGCKDSCRELGYAYAGVEFGEECFCGNTPPLMSTIVGQEECNDPCTGDATQMCGGSWNMNVYQTGPCHVRDMMSAGCSPLPGSQGVFLTDSWHQCGLTCTNNPSCGAWEFTKMSVGLCFNFHLAPEDCIVSGERGLGYVTGYSGCHEGEDMGPPEGTMDPELAQWLVGGTESSKETMDPELAQWLVPRDDKMQEPEYKVPDDFPMVEVEEPEFVQEWVQPLGDKTE